MKTSGDEILKEGPKYLWNSALQWSKVGPSRPQSPRKERLRALKDVIVEFVISFNIGLIGVVTMAVVIQNNMKMRAIKTAQWKDKFR